mmetsp:Transcript_19928/g.43606  ORF Transcript_19928/g.43606 Transcript_19928/m.43606 type:complete len:435 (-) Transcript_19928:184-1488(-)|eukprot:CAMPEP_0118927418 /NCGR_PEP_ID=MMETSP1169-20130426/4894_1 /TAXON_ID=36882 /ORGANISM="Pyramimonas obovata, Strain CCMP722" /LENGTH=434 /DNA_ID=CAMNT_0006869171 /DNA_START=205 /DNA_END=1509 /DNA_ORIENTATION=-
MGTRRRVKDGTPASPGTPTEKTGKVEKVELLAAQSLKNKWGGFRTRTISTLGMLGGFMLVIYGGHVFLWGLIVCIQVCMVHELFKHAQNMRAEKDLPGFRFLQWYFCGVATFFVHGRFVSNNLWVEISSDKRLARLFGWVLKQHVMLSYMLYIAGFVLFVTSLKKGMYLYQFGQYGWTHMILLVVLTQSSFFVANIFEGLWWFLMPTLLVICNDIMAYISGFFFGRTPLTALSPKKTWEGFIGAFFATLIISFVLADVLAQYKWMTCPRTDFTVRGWLDCEVSPVYQRATHTVQELLEPLPSSVSEFLLKILPDTISLAPIQIHALALSMFASIIAPFGGFFASGFKRAFNIKDFGDSIPGHGGLTDRMDCQVIIAVFANIYYNTAVKASVVSLASMLIAVENLAPQLKVDLYIALGNMLVGEGLINDTGCAGK